MNQTYSPIQFNVKDADDEYERMINLDVAFSVNPATLDSIDIGRNYIAIVAEF